MTLKLFIIIFAIETLIATMVTESIKKVYQNENKPYSANLIAMIDALSVGGFGTIAFYIIYDIPFTLTNIVVLIIAIFAVWLGSTLSYDKVMQLIKQIEAISSL